MHTSPSSLDGHSSTKAFRTIALLFLFFAFISAQNNTSCPDAAYGAVYTNTNGVAYQLYCGYDWTQNIIEFPGTDTFEDCLLLCDAYEPPAGGSACGAATWAEALGQTCYLKRAAVDGGILGGQAAGVNTGLKRLPGSVTEPPIDACPDSDNSIYTDGPGNRYTVRCGLDVSGINYYNPSTVPQYSYIYRTGAGGSYQECYYQCGIRPGCLGFTWEGTDGAQNGTGEGGCYFKQQANDCNPVYYKFYLDRTGVYNNMLVSSLREDQEDLIENTCVVTSITETISATIPPTSASPPPVSTTSSTPSATPSICSVPDGTLYTNSGGQRYTIYCLADVNGEAVVIPEIPSLEACLLRCDEYGSSCGSAVYTPSNFYCYLKPPPERGGTLFSGQNQVGVKYHDVTTTAFSTTGTPAFPTTTMTTSLPTSSTPSSTPESSSTSTPPSSSASIPLFSTTVTVTPIPVPSTTPFTTTSPSTTIVSSSIPLFSTTVTVIPIPSTTPLTTTSSSTTILSSTLPFSSMITTESLIPTIPSSYTKPTSTTLTPTISTTLTSTSSSTISSSPALSIPETPTIISSSLTSTILSSTLVSTSTVSSESFTSGLVLPTPYSSTDLPDDTTISISELATMSLSSTTSDTPSASPSAPPTTIPSSVTSESSNITSVPISVSVSSPITTSTLSSTASYNAPISVSVCAPGIIETQLSSTGKVYAVECAADTDGQLVDVVEAPNSYTQCFDACDAAPQCLGFTYIGAVGSSYGVGLGQCYLKAPIGSQDIVQLIPGMPNYVAAVNRRPITSGTSSMTSTTTTTPSMSSGEGLTTPSPAPSISSPTSSSGSISSELPGFTTTPVVTSPVSVPSEDGSTPTTATYSPTSSTTTAAACTSTGQQTFTSGSGNVYDVQCSSVVSNIGSHDLLGAQASDSHEQCFGFCDSAALCEGFTYIGATGGSGPGICYLYLRRSFSEPFTPLAFAAGDPTNVAAIRRRPAILPPPTYSTTTRTSTSTSTATPAASSCLTTAVSTIVSTAGNTYRTQCGARTSGGTVIVSIVVSDGSQGCYVFCDAGKDCVAFTYEDSRRECILLAESGTGGPVSLVGGDDGSGSGFFAAVRVLATGPTTTPAPSPPVSGSPSGGSGTTGPTTASESSLKFGCVLRTTVLAVTV